MNTIIKAAHSLDGIEPFNDFFYCSCFYNALIPILNKYDIPISPVLINCLPCYKKYDNGHLGVGFVLVRDMQQLLSSLGVVIQGDILISDIIAYIEKKLSVNQPIILFVDCFYLPYRKDTFKKTHLGHSLLIYGYNSEEGLFSVIEHSDQNTLDFKKMKISYNTVRTAYAGYLRETSGKLHTIFSFTYDETLKVNNRIDNLHYQLYIRNTSALEEKIRLGIATLKWYVGEYEKIVSSKELLATKYQEILLCFQYIIKAKKGDRHLLNVIYAEQLHTKIADEIFHRWCEIHNIIQHYAISQRYKEQSLQRTIRFLYEIVDLEDQLYSYLLEKQ